VGNALRAGRAAVGAGAGTLTLPQRWLRRAEGRLPLAARPGLPLPQSDAHWCTDPGALVNWAVGRLADVSSWTLAAPASRPAQRHCSPPGAAAHGEPPPPWGPARAPNFPDGDGKPEEVCARLGWLSALARGTNACRPALHVRPGRRERDAAARSSPPACVRPLRPPWLRAERRTRGARKETALAARQLWQARSAWLLQRVEKRKLEDAAPPASSRCARPRAAARRGWGGGGRTCRARGMGIGPPATSAIAPDGSASLPSSGSAASARSPRADDRACGPGGTEPRSPGACSLAQLGRRRPALAARPAELIQPHGPPLAHCAARRVAGPDDARSMARVRGGAPRAP